VGVIARADLLGALALKLIQVPEHESDKAIGDHILAALGRERWAPQSGIRVHVADAVVALEGVIFSDSERQAVRVIAENAPGVKTVNDRLVYVDPGSGMAISC
jgi:osmotically-inducible protein OsmY